MPDDDVVRKRPYVVIKGNGAPQVIRSPTRPAEQEGDIRYKVVIGPFKTLRGAAFMANNPQCRSVNEAERLSKGS